MLDIGEKEKDDDDDDSDNDDEEPEENDEQDEETYSQTGPEDVEVTEEWLQVRNYLEVLNRISNKNYDVTRSQYIYICI